MMVLNEHKKGGPSTGGSFNVTWTGRAGRCRTGYYDVHLERHSSKECDDFDLVFAEAKSLARSVARPTVLEGCGVLVDGDMRTFLSAVSRL